MNSTVDRKRIFIFVAITFGITIAAAAAMSLSGGTTSDLAPQTNLAGVLMLVIAFAPALGNIVTRLVTREGWSNLLLWPNLRRGWPVYPAAWGLPLVAILLGGAIYFLFFPGEFDLSMVYARETESVAAAGTSAAILGREILAGLSLVLVLTFVIWGEEFGWRAYLLPKLIPLGVRPAILLSGAVWGAWHWPMIFMGFQYGLDYWGAPIVGPLLFVLIILSPSVVYSWMTLRTGSVWPACIAHAVNNAFCVMTTYFLKGEPNALIGPGVEGIVGCLGYVLVALPILLIPGALAHYVPAASMAADVIEPTADSAFPAPAS
ncbi:MAG TPA: CPBP family intramembrane glutamic endopeptidase [Anaerolineales bacterium]|nr:CPBP family intramembrane glutamic endopeptidase [Anaerolineales bacterium]